MIAGILSLLAASAFSQGLVEGIRESTDPAKIAAVEQRAAEIRQQQAQNQSTTSTKPAHSKMRHHGKTEGSQSHAKTPSTDNSSGK